jgi:hypothetical protein
MPWHQPPRWDARSRPRQVALIAIALLGLALAATGVGILLTDDYVAGHPVAEESVPNTSAVVSLALGLLTVVLVGLDRAGLAGLCIIGGVVALWLYMLDALSNLR